MKLKKVINKQRLQQIKPKDSNIIINSMQEKQTQIRKIDVNIIQNIEFVVWWVS